MAMKNMVDYNGQEVMLGTGGMASMVCKDGKKKKDRLSTSQ